MAKRLNIDLAFNADTGQAKQAIAELQSALSKIATMNTNMPGMDPAKIKSASTAAKELSIHLNNAFNAQTGNFDLSKLDRSLKTSSTNVTELSTKLLNAGASGQQAFVKLAQTIAAADRPVVSLNSKLSGMLTTLKNTARWQLSSSILHGFMGAVQSAFGYAQDLNESLNNIRIVSGQTTEQMAEFAEQANKAAKNLSTTTNEYAKAALIFYQQGDSGDTINKKSDVVTKMSNVTGQSAEVVSNQLTAIWNNFNKAGTESYEHYADILTALGAATASSTDEIAGGLEKFSGIAETIGLSYEYAASALATITAVSRESEDVVGTALKTIFSRIQGLKQGETLEDGTDLNKYSQSLMNVGISIKDQNGQLKEMDDILDEMGAKWQTLSKDQQMALAQSVAGVRQYNQLMTLMNNWDYMQENVQVARNSDGELQKQQALYEESWKAANDRVRASMEAIYRDLIDDEFFIDITNGFSSMIDSVDAFIDGVGGVKTLLIGIGSIFLSSIANKITPALQNLKHTFSVVFKSAEEQAQMLAKEMNAGIDHVLQTQNLNTSNTVALENAKKLNEAKAKLQAVEQNLTQAEKQRANADLQGIQIQQQEIQTIADKITKLHEEKEAILNVAETAELTAAGRKTYASGSSEIDSYLNSARKDLRLASTDEEVDAAANAVTAARQAQSQYNTIKEEIISSIGTIDNAFRNMGSSLNLKPQTEQVTQLDATIKQAFGENLTDIQKNLSQLGDEGGVGFESIRNQVDLLVNSMPKAISQSEEMQNALTDVFTAKTKDQMQQALEKIREALKNSKIDAEQFMKILQEINPKRYAELKANIDSTDKATEELTRRQKELNASIEGFNPQHVASKMESFTKLASGLGSVAMAAQSVRSIFQAWNNDDISFGEKLISTFIALPMALSSAQRAFSTFNGLLGGSLAQIIQATTLQSHYNAAVKQGAVATLQAHAAKMASEGVDKAKIASDLAELAVTKNLCTEKEKEAFIEKVLSGEKTKSAIVTGMETAVVKINTAAQNGNRIAKLTVAAAEKLASVFGVTLTTIKTTETGAVVANTAAWYANPIMWIAIVIAAAIAAIALLVSWIVKMTTGLSASEQKLEDAKKATEAMSEAADKAKESYQTLLDTINNYDSAIEKIEELTAGTNEFTQALLTANGYAKDLIDKYDLLANDYYIDENGVIQFKTGVLDNITETERENVEGAEAMLMGAQIYQNNAQRDVDIDNIGNGYDVATFDESGWVSLDRYGAENVYNAVIEKGFNNMAEFIQSDSMTDEEKKNVIAQAMYGDMYGEEYSGYENLMYEQQQFIDGIFNNFAEGMADYEKLIVDNELKNEGLIKSNLVNSLSDEQAYQQSDYKNYIVDQVLSNDNWEQTKSEADKKYENMDKDEVETAFQNALGDNYIYEDGKVYSKDEKGEKGDEVEGLSDLSTDQMRDYLASGDAIQILEEEGAQLASVVNSITANLSEEDKAFADAILNGNFSSLSKEDISKLQGMSPDEIKNMFPFLGMLETFGIDIDTLLGNLTTEITEWEPPKIDLSGTVEEFSEVQKIISDLKFGDAISEEDYLKLGEGAENYFTKMADGTYKLTGDAEEFYNLISQQQTKKLLNDAQWAQEYGNNLVEDKNKADAALGGMSLADIGKNYYNADNNTATYGNIDNQIDFAQEMGTMTQEDADFYRAKLLENGGSGLTGDEIERITEAAKNGVIAYQDLTNEIDNNKIAIENSIATIFNGATSLEDFNNKVLSVNEALGEDSYSQETYANGLVALATEYEHCTQEIQKYKAALSSGQGVEEAQEALETSIKIGEEAESYDLVADQVEAVAEGFLAMAEAGDEQYETLKDDSEALKDAAVRYTRLNEAVADLYDNYEEYNDILKDIKKATNQADKAMIANSKNAKALKTSLAGLLGTSEDLITVDLLDAIDPEDFKKAAEGDTEAINRIRDSFIDLITTGYLTEEEIVTLKDALNNLGEGNVIDIDNTPLLQKLVQSWVDAGMTAQEIEDRLSGMNIDADVTPFNEAMAEMVTNADAAGSAVVKSTSYTQEAEVVEEPTPNTNVEFQEKVSVNYRRGRARVPLGEGFSYIEYDTAMPYYTKTVEPITKTDESATTAVGVTTKNGNGESGEGGVIIQNAHKSAGGKISSGNSSRPTLGSGGGGGGGTPSAPSKVETRDTTKKSDVAERYREVTDAIDNVTDALDRADRATNRLWGRDKLNAMREENKILRQQYNLLVAKSKEAEAYAKQDYKDLIDTANDIGVSIVVDADTGDITNIEDIENLLYNRLSAAEAEYNRKVEEYNSAVDAAGDSPTEAKVKELETMKDALDAYEKDIIGGIEDDIETWEDAEQQFQDTIETWEDAGLEAEDILDQMMQKNFDIWSESLQLEVEVNDKDLELLDYYLSKIEDNVYEMAEAAALMVGNLNSGFKGGQLGEYLDNLSIYGERYAELTDRLNSTDPEYQITSAQYKEGLDEIQSGLLDNLSSIQELDNAMMNYYSDTLSMVNEEIDKYSEKMEHQTSILEHYASMMDILGKSQDYEAMGEILEGQVKTIKNELDVAEAEYNLYAEEAEKKRKLYEEAVASGDVAAAELYKGEWEAAEEAAMEAQSNMLDKTEQWAEAMKAVVENKLNGLAKSLEMALTGGTSFDQINTQLERAASLQEEYLTTTNQIYETNKLMRTAQQEIDKSTNTVAKQRLKAFIKETDQLQDKSKLSKYELDIQKAKYDLLLAEIALEDAQNAKSTVRLQRDSEGNFGYVYTADQNQLSQAQQKLEDAQNSLYNIALEGANDYTEKYNQTLEEMYDTLTSITQAYYSGEIASREEYEAQMLAAQEYYYEQLQNFQDLYGIALQTDTRVIKDAWSTGMGAMKVETDSWKNAVQTYTGEATSTLMGWYSAVEDISNREGLTNIAGQVKTITDESEALKDTILGTNGEKGVIGALGEELNAVSSLTGGYAGLRQTIQGVIADYERMMSVVKGESSSQGDTSSSSNGDTSSGSTPGSSSTGTPSSSDNGTSSDNSPSEATGKGDGSGGSTALTWDRIMEAYEHIVSGDWGNGIANRVANGKKDGFTQEEVEQAQQYINYTFPTTADGLGYSASYAKQLMGFDTGGYTGEWSGAYGKMALLHQKELVLNEQDTANFLASMEVLERILAIIDLQSASAQLGGLLTTPSIGGNDTVQTVEQSVRIEASFPGVSDRNEIEEAFNNLINTASQYANRK